MSINIGRDEKTGRVASLKEVIEQRFEKLNQDLQIMQSRAGVRKEQVSQKNLDQLMNLLGKKIQKFNFTDTEIGQNHYKLVQKGMDAPQLERKLQEQRFLAEKELSSTSGQEKSVFWIDITFSKEGIDMYLEKNQIFVAFKAVYTMRSVHAQQDTFANRLMAKKNQLRGMMGSLGAGPCAKGMIFNIPESRGSSYLQQPENIEVYMRAMKQFQLGAFGRYTDYLGKHSRDFKEVWQLLEKMTVSACQRRSQILQRAYQEGVYYLEKMYRKQLKHKKHNFQRIYEVYNVDQIRSFEDESMPLWQEMYQFFRAGDYKSIFLRCEQYIDVPEIQEFGQDLTAWLDGGQSRNNFLGQKMRPNWDAFRYQIYLILMKDPQCVDDVFIEDLDDCLWMNLKCCQASVFEEEGYNQRQSTLNGDSLDNFQQMDNTLESESEVENFYESILERVVKAKTAGNVNGQENLLEEEYSWIDWKQLEDLRKMLYESFKESPEVFNPSRVLMIQLLTLDFIGFAQTLRSLEKNGISQDECVHMLILIMKTGLLRASVECAMQNTESSPDSVLQLCREFEQFAEKYILLYATEIFETYPDLSLSYVQTLPLRIYTQLSRFAEIIVGSKQDCRALFEKKASTSGTISRTQWEQQVFTVNHRMKNAIIAVKTTDQTSEEQSQLSMLARIVAQIIVKKQHKVETALEILESVSAFEEIGILVKEQYRILSSVYEIQSVKNHLKNQTDNKTSMVNDILEKFAEKYFTQKSNIVYKNERKQRIDAHIVQFYRLTKKIKQFYQNSDLISITNTLQQMQELHYISSAHRESASSEFYDSLKKEDLSQASYFEFLYLFYLSCKKFFENLKTTSFYNQAHQPYKPEEIEKAKKIFKNILNHSNLFYTKYQQEVDKDFEKYLTKAKYEAQSACQI